MDDFAKLKEELKRKREALLQEAAAKMGTPSSDPASTNGNNSDSNNNNNSSATDTLEAARPVKYIKRSDLEAKRREEYLREQQQIEEERRRKLEEKIRKKYGTDESEKKETTSKTTEQDAENVPQIPAKEVIRRLRKRGEPIRLFGETDQERVSRLRSLELADPDGEGQLNEYLEKMNKLDQDLDEEEILRKARDATAEEKNEEKAPMVPKIPIATELYKSNKDILYGLIHDFWKGLLEEWGKDLEEQPIEIKRTAQGKAERAIQAQSESYLEPFFKLLRNKSLPDDILIHITRICESLQKREYIAANDTYYLLSIGNAPWPIGVTMVGIHERSGREKIFSNQIAHVLNDEKTRKWIQSMKRLMTYCQTKYPPADLSNSIGWIKS